MSQASAVLREALIRNFNQARDEVAFSHGERFQSTDDDLVNREVAPGLGAVITSVQPGKTSCPYHLHHAQTEMFVVVEGSGTLRVAGEMLPISVGDVITIPPGGTYPHHIINTSDKQLRYLSISTREQPELCEYPDSQKTMGFVRGGHRVMNRSANNLDYFDGE